MNTSGASPVLDRRKSEGNPLEKDNGPKPNEDHSDSSPLPDVMTNLEEVSLDDVRNSIEQEAEEYEEMDSIALDNSQTIDHDYSSSLPLQVDQNLSHPSFSANGRFKDSGNEKDDDTKAVSGLKRHSADSDTLRLFNTLSVSQSNMQTSLSSLNSADNASIEEISVPEAPRLDPLPENDVLRVQVVLPSRLMDILGDAAGALGDEIEMDLTQSTTPSPSVPPSRRGSIAAFQRRDSRAATPVSAEAIAALPRIMSKTTIIHSSDESPQETFERLIRGIRDGSMEKSEIEDQLFNTLVGGQFDLETRYIIEDSSNIERMLTLLTHADETLQAEIWSVFLAIVRKSKRNLEACSRISLISKILDILPETDGMLSDLLVQLLGVLTNYSITVKETKQFLRSLQAVNNAWPRNSLKLLQVMKQMPVRDNANVFFSFPGKSQAGIIVPPFAKFPCQSGWTFSTWLRMDPMCSALFEKEKPYLYCFRSSKMIGYSCHFMGNALVVTAEKSKGKVVTKCTKKELTPRKWHHIAISHSYSRWGRSEIRFYFDGELSETAEINWAVSTTEQFDRCAIGVSPEGDPDTAFCGQMGAVYLFADSLSLEQANSLFCLGPAYQSYFVHDSGSNLPEGYKKHLFDGRLSNALVMAYCPKNCHGQLCLNSPAKVPSAYFVQVPHAVMKEGVEVITTHSIHSSLQSVGGIQILLPLFSQLDHPCEDGNAMDGDMCSTLLSLISLLLASSQTIQQQLYHSKGFLIIGHALQKSSNRHITMKVAEQVIDMAKFLLRCSSGGPLIKQLFEHIMFNPKLWINSEPDVQVHLYNYLATDFLANINFHHIIRQVATFGEMCHALKFYYWVTLPKPPSAYQVEERPESFPNEAVIAIRGSILLFLNRLILLSPTNSSGQDAIREQEIHQIMNFVATVHEDDNLYDVLALLNRLLGVYPHIMVPMFDKDKAVGLVFKLLSSPNQLIRIPALKMFGFFLQRSTLKRKTESVTARHLYTLITERLLIHADYLTIPTYITLFEILTEQMTPDFTYTKKEAASADWRFENPMMLKVIANLITQSAETNELMRVKKAFLLDMINMCRDGKDNRRTILQMSVWQEWLISIAYVFPKSEEEEKNMPSGGVLRQVLRLISTAAVRHILTARVLRPDSNGHVFEAHANPKNEAIYEFVKGAIEAQGKEGIVDLDRLLQDVDLQRIKGAVYRDMVEENRQAQFLALAVVYLLSVLMVSRYRDILEPPASPSPFFNSATNGEDRSTLGSSSTAGSDAGNAKPTPSEKLATNGEAMSENERKEGAESISAIMVAPETMKRDGKDYKAEELSKLGASSSSAPTQQPAERRQYLTSKLQTALETTAPLLREIMSDFRSFFQKTLLGTHGQEIMNDSKVLETLKNRQGSVIELVMLLCSQEWQTSLQKHAGLAFIELVNEGRLMAHATRDHVLRVSNEADFILNRLRAEDVSKHAHFESETMANLDV
ncbi:DUF4704 domain-containing protein, partial [Trichostrongylus colubriformis]